jgi:hypothetical protein
MPDPAGRVFGVALVKARSAANIISAQFFQFPCRISGVGCGMMIQTDDGE